MKDVWTIVLIVACLLLLPGCGGVNVVADPVDEVAGEPATARQSASGQPTVEQSPAPQHWGVEVEGLRLTSADYMLDFRYRVTDPDKAHELLKRNRKPYLLDKATGAKMHVPCPPKVGPLRTTALKPQKDKTYYVMFANPGRFIKRGAIVDIVIGDFVAKDIVVQ